MFFLTSSPLNVHPCSRPQIAGLIAKKAPTKVSVKYANFADMFFPDLASELSEYTRINDHTIELVNTIGFITNHLTGIIILD